MKVLNLSLGETAFNRNSPLAKRLIEYGELVNRYLMLIPGDIDEKIALSEKTEVLTVGGGSKTKHLFKIYNLAQKMLRQDEFDLITVQDSYYLALVAWWLAKKFKKGLEIQVHGFEKFYGLRRLVARFVLPRADAIRVVSRRLSSMISDRLGVSKEKITVVPIYTEIKLKNRETSVEKNKFIFLTVGRLAPIKNISLQIEALAEIKKNEPDDQSELWIAGEGAEKKNLERLVNQLKLESAVKFLGWRGEQEMEDAYQQADVFVLTSRYEGWGLAVIEAASWGLPIIMTDVGCANEVFFDQKNAVVISSSEKNILAQAMARLIDEPEMRQKLGEAARQAVMALPGKEKTWELYRRSWETAAQTSRLRLLVVTQKIDINDDLLGFMHDWVAALAKKCQQVIVICLQQGEYNLPKNVRVLSLGKERAVSRIAYLSRFYRYIWQERKNYSAVFVHMNPENVLLGGVFWRLWGKKIILWYVHKLVDFKLWLSEKLVKNILTASRASFKLKSRKIKELGHGINPERFFPGRPKQREIFQIIYAGRISPIKNQLWLVEAVAALKDREQSIDFKILFLGSAVYDRDKRYLAEIKKKIAENRLEKYFDFLGSVPFTQMAGYYQRVDLGVNLCPTGGLDKAVLEAMACGRPVLVSNRAFEKDLGDHVNDLVVKQGDIDDLAKKIKQIMEKSEAERLAIGDFLRGQVLKRHSLNNLIDKIIDAFKK